MKVIKTTVYEYSELSPDAQEKARNWLHECLDSVDFLDVLEDFNEVCTALGVTLDRDTRNNELCICWDTYKYFSASFTGTYSRVAGMREAIKKHAPEDTELHVIADMLSSNVEYVTIRQHVGYGCEFFIDAQTDNKIALDAFKRLAAWLYKCIEKQEQYLYSDEYAADTMQANGYTFTEDGARFG